MQQIALPMADTFLEVLRDTVRAIGGPKTLGPALWPEKPATEAAKLLDDCLNPNRRERLNPDQVLFVMRCGRQAGVDIAMQWLCGELGYMPPCIADPVDETERMLSEIHGQLAAVPKLVAAAERLAKRLGRA